MQHTGKFVKLFNGSGALFHSFTQALLIYFKWSLFIDWFHFLTKTFESVQKKESQIIKTFQIRFHGHWHGIRQTVHWLHLPLLVTKPLAYWVVESYLLFSFLVWELQSTFICSEVYLKATKDQFNTLKQQRVWIYLYDEKKLNATFYYEQSLNLFISFDIFTFLNSSKLQN